VQHRHLAIQDIDPSTHASIGTLARNQEESAEVFKDHFEKNVFNRTEESSYDDTIFDEIGPIDSMRPETWRSRDSF
jgi:hypothetical protein